MGPEAPSKDCSMFLKRARPRVHAGPGQESCASREGFFSTAAGHKQNIEKYISTCVTEMTSSISPLCITTPSHQSTSDSLVWGIRLKNYHTGFLRFLHLPLMLFWSPTGWKTFASDECRQADIKNCGSFVSKKPSGHQCNIKERTLGALLSFCVSTTMAE